MGRMVYRVIVLVYVVACCSIALYGGFVITAVKLYIFCQRRGMQHNYVGGDGRLCVV